MELYSVAKRLYHPEDTLIYSCMFQEEEEIIQNNIIATVEKRQDDINNYMNTVIIVTILNSNVSEFIVITWSCLQQIFQNVTPGNCRSKR